MPNKIHGPCSVQNCQSSQSRYRTFTKCAYDKAVKKGSYPIYNYLEIGQPICYPHYLAIAEPDRYTRYKNTEIPPSDLSDDKSKDINSGETIGADAHDLDSFKEAFQKSKRYPYTMSDLEYLSEKTREKRKRKSKINQYKLASLELEVDLMCLPIGFSTGSPPKMELTEEDIENPNAEEGDEEEQDEVELNINNQERMSIEFHNALNNIKE
ncbi:24398_t:CDS:2, partial [Entrophospora sp. SA101]